MKILFKEKFFDLLKKKEKVNTVRQKKNKTKFLIHEE